jgi:integrase
VLTAAGERRNASRWSVGLACGLRQGEALGLRWEFTDLDAGEMHVWWQLQRLHQAHRETPSLRASRDGLIGPGVDGDHALRSGEICSALASSGSWPASSSRTVRC